MKILLAEDDAISKIALKDILKAEPSWNITETADGQEAWGLLMDGFRPDLCIFDIKMPRLDGVELVRLIRTNPQLFRLPIVMISGLRDRQIIINLAKQHIAGYLLKPFEKGMVLVTLRKALGVDMPPHLEDPATLMQKLKTTPKRYGELLDLLLKQLERGLMEIREASMSGDRNALSTHLTTMINGCADLGVLRFHHMASKSLKQVDDLIRNQHDFIELEQEIDILRKQRATLTAKAA